MKKWDAVIIGSGISSLTCAALLSKKGKSVCVLEQYNKPGGYLHCFSRFGVRFDTGAHYVGAMGEKQPFRSLLSYLGVYDESLFVELDPNGFDVFRFPEFEIEFPRGYTELIDRLSSRFPEERKAIQSYFQQIRQVVTNFPTYEFKDEVDMTAVMNSLETSLKTVVTGLTRNPQLISVLYAYCALHGVEPDSVSFGLHAIVTDSLIRGPYGLTQGGDALAAKYVKQIEKNGGEVHLKKRVVEIETTGQIANAVITADGQRYETDWVISGTHPKTTFQLVSHPEIFSAAFRERMQKIQETVGIFGIYALGDESLGLSKLKNYYYFGTSDPDQMLTYKNPETPPNAVFLSPASRAGENEKSRFSMNIHAASPVEWFSDWRDSKYGKRPEAYEEKKEAYCEQVFHLLERYHPGFRKSLSRHVSSTPLTNLHFNGSPDGSSYGIHHTIQNTGARALGPRTHIANLLLTGQSCLFPGLLGAATSALRTSGHIIGIKPLLKELREIGGTG